VTAHASFGRTMLIFRGTSAAEVQAHVERAIAALGDSEDAPDEPMFNLLGHFHANHYSVVLFPRAAHRPACYFAAGSDKLSISPAVLEMCGLFVATEPEHFDRIDAETARGIYEEVTLSSEQLRRLTYTL
jgi:hypothetical protein